jgi:uncharacterized protein YjbI with pentapeptide repeats
LSGGEILDLYFEVKWCWGLKEFCPGGYCCILGVGVMTAEELLERYAAGERDFSGIEIEASDELVGSNLTGINLSGAILAEMMLDRVDLSFANLRNAHFGQTSLCEANLKGANLSGASLDLTTLDSADLTDARLIGAYLEGASMAKVNFTRSNLTGAKTSESPYFIGSIFNNTIMPNGDIRTENI